MGERRRFIEVLLDELASREGGEGLDRMDGWREVKENEHDRDTEEEEKRRRWGEGEKGKHEKETTGGEKKMGGREARPGM